MGMPSKFEEMPNVAQMPIQMVQDTAAAARDSSLDVLMWVVHHTPGGARTILFCAAIGGLFVVCAVFRRKLKAVLGPVLYGLLLVVGWKPKDGEG